MSSLKNKNILLGISGGIAAYKTPELVRLFTKAGANVQVITTPMALRFVTAETLSVVSKNQVYTDFFDKDTLVWNNHVDFGLWADAMIIAPAGANTLAKMAAGINDNLLITTYLSARCPVFFAPAMDLDMYQHSSIKENIAQLIARKNIAIEPGVGSLASGLEGEGRMAEPVQIFERLEAYFKADLPLTGKNVLVSAGPTYESIDPVRFIGNHSSGKMGYAIAEKFQSLGANVVLVSGPVALNPPKGIETVFVESADEMYNACMEHFAAADAVVMAAAVADYKPSNPAQQKIKKQENTLELTLIKNKDILAQMGKTKKPSQVLVGFALETQNESENAQNKLQNKNLDMVVLNSLNEPGAGFGTDTNKVSLMLANGEVEELPLLQKTEIAKAIVLKVQDLIIHKNQ